VSPGRWYPRRVWQLSPLAPEATKAAVVGDDPSRRARVPGRRGARRPRGCRPVGQTHGPPAAGRARPRRRGDRPGRGPEGGRDRRRSGDLALFSSSPPYPWVSSGARQYAKVLVNGLRRYQATSADRRRSRPSSRPPTGAFVTVAACWVCERRPDRHSDQPLAAQQWTPTDVRAGAFPDRNGVPDSGSDNATRTRRLPRLSPAVIVAWHGNFPGGRRRLCGRTFAFYAARRSYCSSPSLVAARKARRRELRSPVAGRRPSLRLRRTAANCRRCFSVRRTTGSSGSTRAFLARNQGSRIAALRHPSRPPTAGPRMR
jgi:hypothetical protein